MRSRWTCWLAALLLLTACGSSTPTKVVCTDGTTVVGELVSARPDAIVIKTGNGATVTIPRSSIASIESVSAPASAAASSSSSSSPAAPSSSSPAATAPGADAASQTGAGTGAGARAGNSVQGAQGSNGSGSGSGNRAVRGADARGASNGAGASDPTLPAEREGGVGGGAASMTIPSGTTMSVVLDEEIGSDSSDVDDTVEAELRTPLTVNGAQLLPAGARLRGTVIDATPSGRADGRGRLALRFDTLLVGDRSTPIVAAPLQWRAPGIAVNPDAKKESSSSFFGRVVSKTKRGLRIGDGRGGAATQGSKEVHVDRGATLKIRLEQPVSLAALAVR